MRVRLQSVLGISWLAVCGFAGIGRLWVLLFHASFYASALYYSVAWFFCLLHLTGAAAGFFLLRGARWGRTLIVCISILIVLATIMMLSGGITLPAAYSVVSVLAAVSLVSMYVSAIFRQWFLLPLVLICIHSAMVALVAVAISTSPDPEAGMAWVLPFYADFPASLLIRAMPHGNAMVLFLIVGGVYWGIIGAIIQFLWRKFTRPT